LRSRRASTGRPRSHLTGPAPKAIRPSAGATWLRRDAHPSLPLLRSPWSPPPALPQIAPLLGIPPPGMTRNYIGIGARLWLERRPIHAGIARFPEIQLLAPEYLQILARCTVRSPPQLAAVALVRPRGANGLRTRTSMRPRGSKGDAVAGPRRLPRQPFADPGPDNREESSPTRSGRGKTTPGPVHRE